MLSTLAQNRLWLGGRLVLRDVAERDAYLVAYWRNTARARQAFHTRSALTPAQHVHWLAGKDVRDCVWIAERHEDGAPVGMTSLTLDDDGSAECGRMFVDERFARQGYATELEYMRVCLAFEFFQLSSVWLEVYEHNLPMLRIHGKLGWTMQGADLPGHTGPGGRVLLMTLSRAQWGAIREQAIASYNWQLPDWTP